MKGSFAVVVAAGFVVVVELVVLPPVASTVGHSTVGFVRLEFVAALLLEEQWVTEPRRY